MYATCTVRCYGGLYQLKTAAQQCPALGAALAMQKQDASSAVRTFSVIDAARHIGWDSGTVKRQLKSVLLSRLPPHSKIDFFLTLILVLLVLSNSDYSGKSYWSLF